MNAREAIVRAMSPYTVGPLDDEGMLQPSTMPWCCGSDGIAPPYLSPAAIQNRGSSGCHFDLGRVLVRAGFVQLALDAALFDHLIAADLAAETGGEGFSWIGAEQREWSNAQQFDVRIGATFELHTVAIAMMRGVDVAAIVRGYGVDGVNDDFQAVQIDGRALRDLWGESAPVGQAARDQVHAVGAAA